MPSGFSSRSKSWGSTYFTSIALASATTEIIRVIAISPSSRSVVAALRLLGLRKAGTPLEIASTPVRAAHPDEKARATRNTRARVVIDSPYPSASTIRSSLDSAAGRVPLT